MIVHPRCLTSASRRTFASGLRPLAWPLMRDVRIPMMMQSLQSVIQIAQEVLRSWNTKQAPWFRGEPESKTPLVPRLYRREWDRTENQIVQEFRSMGPIYGGMHVPRSNTNEWLYLMQHTGAPTRLLDWSAGLLPALFFALQEETPIVWMMNPQQLNALAGSPLPDNSYPMAWGNEQSIAMRNIEAAFRLGVGAVDYPVAFIPTYIHPRMAAQKSRFTVHGSRQVSIASIEGLDQLHKMSIDPGSRLVILEELDLCGISYSSIFPDHDGLGKEMAR